MGREGGPTICGIAGFVGNGRLPLGMGNTLVHRGPDEAVHLSCLDVDFWVHRLSIIAPKDSLCDASRTSDGCLLLAYNGEVYNYKELRQQLGGDWRTQTDTEVVLRAYQKWGTGCLDKFNGMWAFAVWDEPKRTLFAARDRWGVKPFFYAEYDGNFYFASEVKALAAAGVSIERDDVMWRQYLDTGIYDNGKRTFFKNIFSLPPGWMMTYANGKITTRRWYSLQDHCRNEDSRSDDELLEEYQATLLDSVKLRLRSDVPVGITLSGGLDSNTIFYAAKKLGTELQPFSFDEQMRLSRWVPLVAQQAAYYQEMPYGGVPTLMMTRVYRRVNKSGYKVVMGGEGADEQWGGYSWYEGLSAERLKAVRMADLTENKLPRALRFMDRASMQSSVEAREPFLDYRLVELAFRMPERLVRRKVGLRTIAARLGVPPAVAWTPKAPVQSPQTEWLQGSLRPWVESLFPEMERSGLLDMKRVRAEWQAFVEREESNSFRVWQWVSVALNEEALRRLRSMGVMQAIA